MLLKCSRAIDPDARHAAEDIIRRVYDEDKSFWPYGFDINNFDGGLYLISEKQAKAPIGVVGWQERNEFAGHDLVKVGYYTIAILPEYRRNGYAKEAVAKIISLKSAGVDRVRAMVMAHNRPSLGLASKLQVETLVKKAGGLWSGLRGALRSPVAEGILGTEARDVARRGGVNLLMPEKLVPKADPASLSAKTLGWLRGRGALPGVASTMRGVKPGGGVLFAPMSEKLPPSAGQRAQMALGIKTPSFGSDKLMEAQAFKGAIPESRALEDFIGEGGSRLRFNRPQDQQQLRQRLGKQFPEGWILKDRLGMASEPGSMITDRSPASALGRLSPRDFYMAQKRMPLAPLPAWQQKADELINRGTGGAYSNLNRGTREMRVHALNGKVVPYASMSRGSITGSLSPLLPARTMATRRAEAAVQEALNRLPAGQQKTLYGFDVGFDHSGKPFIIEANPSDPSSGASGMLKNWMVQDALGSSIQGKLPFYVKARRGLYGAGALGGAAMMQRDRE